MGVGVVGRRLEGGDGVDGIAVIDGIAAFVQQPQPVEELIDVARGLVYVGNDQTALLRLLLQEQDDTLGVGRREAAGGLVEEKHGGLSEKLQRDVEALALTAGYGLVEGTAHHEVFHLIEVQVLEHLRDALGDILLAHALETETRRVEQILPHGELLHEQVVLRHIADEVARPVLRDVVTVDGDAALLQRQIAVEQRHERRLARSAAAHDGHQLPALQVEGEVVTTVVRAGIAELNAAPLKADDAPVAVLPVRGQHGTEVEGRSVMALEHAALLPHLEDAGHHGDVVHQHFVLTQIGEHEQVLLLQPQRLDAAPPAGELLNEHMTAHFSRHVSVEVAHHLLAHAQMAGCMQEYLVVFVVQPRLQMAELHQAQQHQHLLLLGHFAAQLGADALNDDLLVQIGLRLIEAGKIVVKAEVFVERAYAEMSL